MLQSLTSSLDYCKPKHGQLKNREVTMADSASISSNVQIRQLPLTWIRKMLTTNVCFDHDKDGVVGREDHMHNADEFVRAGNLTGEARDGIYKLYQDYCDLGASQDLPNSSSMSLQLMTTWKYKDNPEIIEKWKNSSKTFFQVLCKDVPGFMTFDNYMIFWNVWGLDKRFARMQFDYMDTNNDGLISREEFVNAYLDYVSNPDENTPNRFFGPLINY
ncbi:unnamed protein product [Owenia fusiformis]|uniref:EF-hand domain-containing protein n=1 Tax=Owenia fusiformis TaxID=6347 RepID=A0A8S4N2L1_OWEFU|nr:unnamed protein product [Owenia fusiformis]